MKKMIYYTCICISVFLVACTESATSDLKTIPSPDLSGATDKVVIVADNPPSHSIVNVHNITNAILTVKDNLGVERGNVAPGETKQFSNLMGFEKYPDPQMRVEAHVTGSTPTSISYQITEFMGITTNSSGNPVISWKSPNPSNVTQFKVFRATNTGSYSVVYSTTSKNVTSWTDQMRVKAGPGTFGSYFQSWYKVVEYRGSVENQLCGELYMKTIFAPVPD